MLSLATATSAGSASGGSTRSSAIGETQLPSGSTPSRDDSTGGREGPSSIGRARRWRPRSMSMHTLVAMRYSHDRTLERPSNCSPAFHARTIVSWTASSASKPDPSIR
jgi:hypothetical protein